MLQKIQIIQWYQLFFIIMEEVRWFRIAGSKFRWITVCTSLSQPAKVHCFSGHFLWNLHLLRNLPKYMLWDKNIYSKFLSRYLISTLITFDPGQCFLSWLNSGSCSLKLREAHFDYLLYSHPVLIPQHWQHLPLTRDPENGSLCLFQWLLQLSAGIDRGKPDGMHRREVSGTAFFW